MEQQTNYYCVIPAKIMGDDELSDKAKLLYGQITGLTNETGYCYASNEYLEKKMKCSTNTIVLCLKNLESRGYIHRELVRGEKNEIVERKIFLVDALIPRLVVTSDGQGRII